MSMASLRKPTCMCITNSNATSVKTNGMSFVIVRRFKCVFTDTNRITTNLIVHSGNISDQCYIVRYNIYSESNEVRLVP